MNKITPVSKKPGAVQVSLWERGVETPADPLVLGRLHHLATHFGPVESLGLDSEFVGFLKEAVELLSLRVGGNTPSR
jgi:hypothetical protein